MAFELPKDSGPLDAVCHSVLYLTAKFRLLSNSSLYFVRRNENKFGTVFPIEVNGYMCYPLIFADNNKSKYVGYLKLPKSELKRDIVSKITEVYWKHLIHLLIIPKSPWQVYRSIVTNESNFWDSVVLSSFLRPTDKDIMMSALFSLRESLHFRYEGRNSKFGVLFSVDYQLLGTHQEINSIRLKRMWFSQLLQRWKGAFILSSAENSLIHIGSDGNAYEILYLVRENYIDFENKYFIVPKELRWVRQLTTNRSLAIVNTGIDEQLLFAKKEILKWKKGTWHRVNLEKEVTFLESIISPLIMSPFLEAISLLGNSKTGSLIVILNDLKALKECDCQKGIKEKTRGKLFSLNNDTIGIFLKLCAIDGCTLIRTDGYVYDAGVIFNVPSRSKSKKEGARTAAATYASQFGVAIKISEDGPISIYQNGEEIYYIA